MATRRWTALVVAAVASLAIGACGGDEESEPEGPDPAGVVPADAVLYADAVVRPEGDQRTELEEALRTLLDEDDPGGFIIDQLERELSAGGFEGSYAEDIEPWLGQRAGAFFLNFDEESDGAFLFETTDEEQSRASIERLIEQEGEIRPATYEGIDYVTSDAGSAAGIAEGFAIVGSEAGFEAAVDASSSESLADSDQFQDAIDESRGEGLVSLYADPDRVLDALAAAGEIEGAQRAQAQESLAGLLGEPVALSAGADEAGFFAELTAQGEAPVGRATDLLERVPDDAWAAFGLADAGAFAAPALIAALASEEAVAGVLDRLQGEGGVALEEFGASIGDAAGWFGGSNVFTSTGGLIVEVTDEAAATEALERLREGLSADPSVAIRPGDLDGEAFSAGPADVPIEFPFVLRDGLLVTGLGEPSVEQAYAPESSLTDSTAYEAGQDALGEDFSTSLLIDFQALVGFFEGLDVVDDPDLQQALPYLARLDVFAAGARDDDGATTLRFILRPHEGE